MRPVGALLCTAMALLVPVPAVPEEQALAIVVHRARTDALDIEDVARIYLRKRRFWDDGAPIVALHRELGTAARAFFSRRVLRETVMGEMEEPKIFARQHQQGRAYPREHFVGPATRESGSMDALVQRAEQKTENDPVQDQRGHKPQVTATRPNHKSGRAQRPRMERELPEAAGIRSA